MSNPQICILNPTPQVVVVRRWGLWETVRAPPSVPDKCSYEGGPRELPHPFGLVRTQYKDSRLRTRRRICWCLDLGLPASRTGRNQSLLFVSQPVYSTLLQQPRWTEIVSYSYGDLAESEYLISSNYSHKILQMICS